MRILCEINGLNPASVAKAERLEAFQVTGLSISDLKEFQRVKEVCFIQSALSGTHGIEECRKLEKLWLQSCQIKEIGSIGKCASLEELYLDSNYIKTTLEISSLVNLHTLWISDNQITKIEGLDHLINLRKLWLPRNKIETIGTSLDNNKLLREVNLADNNIGNFKEIVNLARLPELRNLYFNDPHFGSNPVCVLCNYQTYVLYHLQQLESLDALLISPEAKQLAEATYMKKKMYYNMRIKTMKRNASNVVKKATKAKNCMIDECGKLVRDLEKKASDLHLLKHESEANDQVNAAILAWHQLQTAVQRKYLHLKQRVQQFSMDATSRLLMELETGGNIRLEDGRPSDDWFASCVKLVTSQFDRKQFVECGIENVQVSRVCRIHNRFLRNRFNQFVEKQTETDPEQSMEYMFLTCPPANEGFPNSVQFHVMAQNGFTPKSNIRESKCFPPNGILYDSTSLPELHRVRNVLQQYQDQNQSTPFWSLPSDGMDMNTVIPFDPQSSTGRKAVAALQSGELQLPPGQLLVAKVFVGKSMELDEYLLADSSVDEALSIYTEASSGRRIWLPLNACSVLPEYLIDIDYSCNSREVVNRSVLPPKATAPLEKDLSALIQPLVSFMQLCDCIRHGHAAEGQLHAYCSSLLSQVQSLAEVALKIPTKVQNINDISVLFSDIEKLNEIVELNLNGNMLTSLEELKPCFKLENLVASFNNIDSLDNFPSLMHLKILDLSFNGLSTLNGIEVVPDLEKLNVSGNQLASLDCLESLRNVHHLKSLNLQYNPICLNNHYPRGIIRMLSCLKELDHQSVTSLQKAVCAVHSSGVSEDLIKRNCTMSLHTAHGGWAEQVEALELDHLGLQRIENLVKLKHLRRLSLASNEIVTISGLDECSVLEELNLEDNRISELRGLTCLTFLKKLDLGSNQITSLQGLEGLSRLTQLSLEDNAISSMSGIENLPVLMELYLGNNQLRVLKEVQFLKSLEKLVILDLNGNPLCNDEHYRLYTVYHLRKVKVLDSVGVDANEQMLARDKYCGKLTKEFLVDKIGTVYFERIHELDLNSCKIREIETLTGNDFTVLRELNLDQNLLTNISGLEALSNLTVLRLSYNRIETLIPPTDNVGLAAMPRLEKLFLGFNEISDMNSLGLATLPNLKLLNLQGNAISRIDGLSFCPQLQELVLDKNRIKFVDPHSFVGLPNLRHLSIEETGLRSLSNFSVLSGLQALFLSGNRIPDSAEAEKLVSLPNLVDLVLSGNPLARKQNYRGSVLRRLTSLRFLDGKEITIEERERVEAQMISDRLPFQIHQDPTYHGNIGQLSKVPVKLTSVNFDNLGGKLASVKYQRRNRR
eukprot:TRINITY_DN26150_c0_g1_i1.p1 TRINITY_DN26150_c0_g1~~TRINITY_DN26150_c0_g1_i1.p1  ORF type:complete len:1335 (+),score=239.95 TRINITY_DN26150_c0_g1_i1:107-4111(+)